VVSVIIKLAGVAGVAGIGQGCFLTFKTVESPTEADIGRKES